MVEQTSPSHAGQFGDPADVQAPMNESKKGNAVHYHAIQGTVQSVSGGHAAVVLRTIITRERKTMRVH